MILKSSKRYIATQISKKCARPLTEDIAVVTKKLKGWITVTMRLTTDGPVDGACVAKEAQQQPSLITIFAAKSNAISPISGYLAGGVASAGFRKIAALTSAEDLLAFTTTLGSLLAFTKLANNAVAHHSMS